MRIWVGISVGSRLAEDAVRKAGAVPHEIERPLEVEGFVHGGQVVEMRRLRELHEGEAMAGIVAVQEVAGKGEQLAPVLRAPLVVQRVELLQPGAGAALELRDIRRHADLAADELARRVHHHGQLAAGEHAAGIEDGLVGHEQPGRGLLRQRDGGDEMRADALPVADQLGQLLLHGLEFFQARLPRIPHRRADHHVGREEHAQHIGEGAVAVQRGAHLLGRDGVAVEEHVLPGDEHVVQHHQRLDLVEARGEGGVLRPAARGEGHAADVLHARRAHLHDAADGVDALLLVGPGADGGLEIGLVGIGRGRLELGAADDDAGIRLLHDADHHVRVALLRRARAVALGVGVGGDVEEIEILHALDVVVDIGGKARVDLGEDVASVLQRPHLADRLVAEAGGDAADILHQQVDAGPFAVPVLLRGGWLLEDGVALATLHIGEGVLVGRLVGEVVHAGLHVHDGLEGGVGGDVLHALALDPDLAAVADALAVLVAGANHGRELLCPDLAQGTSIGEIWFSGLWHRKIRFSWPISR
jgi:hypothetical protein